MEGSTLKEIIEEIKRFNEERDWDKFHSAENLAKSISIEAGELLECFQWDSENYNKEEACEELADEIIKNTYRTLMTRGQKRCYIYCVDKKLADYLRKRLHKKE